MHDDRTYRLSMTSMALFLLPLTALKKSVPMVGPARYPRPEYQGVSNEANEDGKYRTNPCIRG
jgi:hypothetical protein